MTGGNEKEKNSKYRVNKFCKCKCESHCFTNYTEKQF